MLLASAGAFFFATRVFVDFEPVRVKAVRQPTPAADGKVELRVADQRLEALRAPVAVIARIRNDSRAPQELSLHLDGNRVCAATVPANAGQRIDCVVEHGWTAAQSDHAISVNGSPVPWTLESLELATHHGNSTGVLQGFVLPAASRQFRRPDGLWIALVWVAVALLLLPEPRGFESRAARLVYSLVLTALLALVAVVALSPAFSPYLVVITPATFAAMVLLATLSRTWPAARRSAPVVAAASWIWTWCGTHQVWLVWTMAVAVTVSTGMYGARAVGGSDEYGYASQAELWLNGRLRTEQPFVAQAPWPQAPQSFSPLAYRPDPAEPTVLVPVYSPGLPLLLALAKLIGGQEAMFWVVPLSAGLLVLGTYQIGRRLGTETAGLVAAVLVATSPVVLLMATSLMSDVPVAMAWTWAFYLLLGTTIKSATGAGLLSALAVLIRPNLAPLAGVLAMHYVMAMRHQELRRRAFGQLLAFSAALLPGAVAVGIINAHLYGSPLSSGYGDVSGLFALSRAPTNLRLYLQWFAEVHTPFALCGLVAILIPLRRLWPDVRDRGVFLVIIPFVLGIWGIYCAWLVFEHWGFSRFLLPSWPFIMLGVGSVAVAAYRFPPRDIRALVVVLVIALAYVQLDFARARETFGARDGRRRFVAVARLVQRLTEPNSVILSLDYSGAIRYYGGRMTMMYGAIPGDSLDTIVTWLKAHGVRAYLAVADWEFEEIKGRFAGSACLRALDGPPVAVYEKPGKTLLFDLTEPDRTGRATVFESDANIGPTAGPVAPPGLVFAKTP